MEVVKKTKEFTIVKKKNGRYGVQVKKKWVNGDDKVKILLDAGLSKVAVKKEAPAEVTPAE
jgi:predicted aspartyl protease